MTDGVAHIDIAAAIARRLVRDAFWSGPACTWFGWRWRTQQGRTTPAWSALRADLGTGAAGVGLFLAETGRATGDRLIQQAAYGAFRHCHDFPPEAGPAIGVMQGPAGTALALALGGEVLDDDALSGAALARLLELAQTPPVIERYHWADAAAGHAFAMLAGHRRFGEAKLLEAATAAGKALVDAAVRPDDGTASWPAGKAEQPHDNLVGLPEGAGGIAVVLLHLAASTGDAEFAAVASEALAYEARVFDKTRQLWPDLSIGSATPQLAVADQARYRFDWARGAAGIALARLQVLQLAPDRAETADELEAALRAVMVITDPAQLPVQNFSAALGLAGYGEVLLEAARVFPARQELAQRTGAIAQFGAQNYFAIRRPWPSGGPNTAEAADLLHGLAGIGRFYLRLHDPVSVSCLLSPVLPALAPAASAPAEAPPVEVTLAPLPEEAPAPVVAPAAPAPEPEAPPPEPVPAPKPAAKPRTRKPKAPAKPAPAAKAAPAPKTARARTAKAAEVPAPEPKPAKPPSKAASSKAAAARKPRSQTAAKAATEPAKAAAAKPAKSTAAPAKAATAKPAPATRKPAEPKPAKAPAKPAAAKPAAAAAKKPPAKTTTRKTPAKTKSTKKAEDVTPEDPKDTADRAAALAAKRASRPRRDRGSEPPKPRLPLGDDPDPTPPKPRAPRKTKPKDSDR